MSGSPQMVCPLTATQRPASPENRNSSMSMEISAPYEASKKLTVPVVMPKPDELHAKILTIRTSTSSGEPGEKSVPISPSISISPHLNSPSMISPPSSAFVSALQSPYISPRASAPAPDGASGDTATTTAIASNGCNNNIASTTTTTLPSPTSCSCSHSDDLPSTSHTPPSERFDYPSEPTDQKSKFSDAAAPRISFSFPIPRVSFTKGSISPSSNAKLRSCDVYVGYHGQNHNLSRFCKWLKSELELQGMAAFVADRAKYSDSQSYEIADRIICSAAFGVTVVTTSSFLNPFTIEEVRFFAQKKNLIPLWFDTEPGEISRLLDGNTEDREWQEGFNGLNRCNEFKLEANDSNWRSCISRTVSILKSKLSRKHDAEEAEVLDELPFVQNKCFVGREKELADIEAAFFGCSDVHEMEYSKPVTVNGNSSGFSDGFADEESDTIRTTGRFISLEMRKCKEPTLEAWIEPPVEQSNKGRILQKQRSRHKRSKCSGNRGYGNANVICINGPSGVGKTELALEFAYRYSQRYKIVLWVGGGAKYFRQNILNLSVSLKLDVSAETEKERGRIRSFDEQEFEAFQRVKRDIFRDIPYLIVIDDLETEKEWWEGKDLHDLIPRNTGATHVIVTTRLQKVMSFEPIQLQPLSAADSLLLMRGKRKKDYSAVEVEVLTKFGERLGRLSFGLSVIGSLLAELMISPAELFESIESIQLNDNLCSLAASDDAFCRNNSFLMKVMLFCFIVLDQIAGKGTLASRMVIAGAWLAPAPISTTLLAAAASEIPLKGNKLHQWSKCIGTVLCCYPGSCLASQTRRNEVESALMLVKLGLARRVCRQPGCWIQLNPITQFFAKRRGSLPPAKAAVQGMRKIGNPMVNADHLWASTFLVFGFKSEPPIVQLRAVEMVHFIKRIALPLAIRSFTTFSRCSSALELLKVCTNVLEEVEKSFVSQIQDWQHGSLCWKNKLPSSQSVDEYVWQDVTLLKATLLETRAKLLLRGGHFDNGEELCRTCISIRTVMLGHNHSQTLAAQETLAKLVRFRSKV